MPDAAIMEVVGQHSQRLEILAATQREHARRITDNEQRIVRLDEAMSDLRERFGTVATHDDVQELHTKIDASVNGLLKDALAAVPGRVSLFFTGAMALVALVTLVISVSHGRL